MPRKGTTGKDRASTVRKHETSVRNSITREGAFDELAEQTRDLARDALSAAGYHQRHRGNGENVVSGDIVRARPHDRVMDSWAVGKLVDWAAGKNGNKKVEGIAPG
jgi:hypothetical protein